MKTFVILTAAAALLAGNALANAQSSPPGVTPAGKAATANPTNPTSKEPGQSMKTGKPKGVTSGQAMKERDQKNASPASSKEGVEKEK